MRVGAIPWKTFVTRHLLPGVEEDRFWRECLAGCVNGKAGQRGVHLAIFVEPFLQFVLEGRKTIESRFSMHRLAPYDKVRSGDIIVLKRSGGPVVGVCIVTEAWFYRLDTASWRLIRRDFAAALCAQDPAFWRARKHASYATLMSLSEVLEVPPIPLKRRDRRGWVVVAQAESALSSDLPCA
jgi:hypothetical protein